MFAHKKVTKEQGTPYRLFLALLALIGGNRKLALPNSRLPEPPIKTVLLSAVAGEVCGYGYSSYRMRKQQ